MSAGRLKADPLFLGLARPPMIAGVSYMYFIANAMTTMVLFINTKSFMSFFYGLIIHGFGFLLCKSEPRAVELWMLKLGKGFMSWNRAYHHHTNSYDVF